MSAAAAPLSARVGQVLVVDGDEHGRASMCRVLQARGFDAEAARDAADALVRMEHGAFDVLLAAVGTPGTIETDLVTRAKQLCPDIQAIVVSAQASADTAVAAVRAGADDILFEPFQPADLVASVERAVEDRRLQFSAALHEASRLVLRGTERDRLPQAILALAGRMMAADDASLLLPDGSGRLYVAHTTAPKTLALDQSAPGGHALAERVAALHGPVLLNGEPATDPRFVGLRGTRRPVSSIVYPLRSGAALVGVLTLNRVGRSRPFSSGDIQRAALLAAEIVLTLENERLLRTLVSSEKLAIIGQLAASIVHEINNPLAYVVSNLEHVIACLGELPPPPPEARAWWAETVLPRLRELEEVAGDARGGAQRIMEIVRDMRVIARSEHGGASFFDVADAVKSALRIATAKLSRSTAVLLELTPGLRVHGHPGQISQVVLNVLMNADQAMSEAACRERRLRIRTWREAAHVHVSIGDTGPGIPAAHLGRIFEPFFTTKPEGRGTGLGLSISRDIVVRHGGELRVHSPPGEGATFVVVLPAAD